MTLVVDSGRTLAEYFVEICRNRFSCSVL